MGRLRESFYRHAQETFTDRQWLMLLNSIVLLVAITQIVLSTSMLNKFFHEIIETQGIEKTDAYLGSWFALCSIQMACALAAMFGLCAAQKVFYFILRICFLYCRPYQWFYMFYITKYFSKQVSIDLLVGYFSVSVVIVAPMVLFTICSFQFQAVKKRTYFSFNNICYPILTIPPIIHILTI